ncbi:hypothetical protein PPEP_a3782 [Pseudoalteromonas peptidolytica F12-50-A1]|uniref:Uncharacterized protein n=1 Tax=Pseudoalteromonas peptidolytica F12-50-A1 TaxID=1315280 RepID=A0A8I0T3N4_9GAMM|nr:hypothetical protein [Pseudoalteromonas peptidolytica F12-50-A1]
MSLVSVFFELKSYLELVELTWKCIRTDKKALFLRLNLFKRVQ